MALSLFAFLLFGLALPQQQSADCTACHGDKTAQDQAGHSVYVDENKRKASVHGSLACNDCHASIKEYPHPSHPTKVECATCHSDEAATVAKSIHGALGSDPDSCLACHGAPHAIKAPGPTPISTCATCHADAVQQFQASIHGRSLSGKPPIATCESCHGTVHGILAQDEPASPVAKKNLANTCGSCHSNPRVLSAYGVALPSPVAAYKESVHGQAVAAGNSAAPSCSDCHGAHEILPPQDSKSAISHWNVAQTCGACHKQIRDQYLGSIHGQAMTEGLQGAPVCTDCHGEHSILAPSNPESPVNPARVSITTCGRCHGDVLLNKRYDLPTNRLTTFEDSYHGLALQGGSETVANCASCHGVHDILPSSDARSRINVANLAHTCGQCHPGAGTTFAIGPVHVLPSSVSQSPVVRWIRIIYLILIPLTLGFMFLHNALDFIAKLVRSSPKHETRETVPRMGLQFRIPHWLVMLSFPILVVTGFALKYPTAWWAWPILLWESRFALRGTIHRFAGVVLIASLLYHFAHLALSPRARDILRQMRPRMQDFRDAMTMICYNLGLSANPPQLEKFSYAEKAEYLAFIWGTIIMAVSGLLLWFINFTLRYFPKWMADAATAIHFYEAILATFSILVWHFYMTIFDPDVYPMDRAWLTGRASADQLRRNRPAYYASLAGESSNPQQVSPTPPDPSSEDNLEDTKGNE